MSDTQLILKKKNESGELSYGVLRVLQGLLVNIQEGSNFLLNFESAL